MLPPWLLKELQKHVPGEMLYVPKPSRQRAGWGELSGARRQLAERNEEIARRYADGCSIAELERRYHLSGDSIRKIIVRTK